MQNHMNGAKHLRLVKNYKPEKKPYRRVNWQKVKPVEKITLGEWTLYASAAFLLGYTAHHYYANYLLNL